MPSSKCPRCENTSFEMQENEPRGSGWKYMFIQCARCGTVVGVTEYMNIGALIQKLAKALGVRNFLS